MGKRKIAHPGTPPVEIIDDTVGVDSKVTECTWGETKADLLYPQVSSCTTITLHLKNGDIMGAHLTIRESKAEVEALFDDMNEQRIRYHQNADVERMEVVGKMEYKIPAQYNTSWLLTPEYSPTTGQLYRTLNDKFKRGVHDEVRFYEQPEANCDYKVTKFSDDSIRWHKRKHVEPNEVVEPWEKLENFDLA